jgi:predicted RNase H-like HicB family nuclease
MRPQDRYKIEVFWSDPDDAYIAVVPNVERLQFVSTHGETREAALTELEEVLQFIAELAKEDGNPLPDPGSR